MRARTFLLLLGSQILLVALGGWAHLSGGPVWLLVALVILALSFGLRAAVAAECQHARAALEEENRCLQALNRLVAQNPKGPENSLGTLATHPESGTDELRAKILQLEAELRWLCPSSTQAMGQGPEPKERLD
jgi:hypothetical protein